MWYSQGSPNIHASFILRANTLKLPVSLQIWVHQNWMASLRMSQRSHSGLGHWIQTDLLLHSSVSHSADEFYHPVSGYTSFLNSVWKQLCILDALVINYWTKSSDLFSVELCVRPAFKFLKIILLQCWRWMVQSHWSEKLGEREICIYIYI